MIESLEKIAASIGSDAKLRELVQVESTEKIHHFGATYPLYAFHIGSKKVDAPVLFLVGGVHGIERIGAQLAWSFLKTTVDRLQWDQALIEVLQRVRITIVPLLNPVGYYNFQRCNGNGVDLMRNAPVDAIDRVPPLLGGHRISSRLPWYRGQAGELQAENQFLERVFFQSAGRSSTTIALDFHSGFGTRDRLWFPFSYTKTPFHHLEHVHILTEVFEDVYPYHVYQIEPQSDGYLLNGDVWDYLLLKYQAQNAKGVFLPFTLEMGSWNWVRKNPLQLFTREGVFNPIKEHRLKRTFRRHHLLFDFLVRSLYSNSFWTDLSPGQKSNAHRAALKRWYRHDQ